MSIVTAINQALNTAIRNKDAFARTLLKTVLGEAQSAAKRESAEGVIDDVLLERTVRKFIKNNNKSLAARGNPVLDAENTLLSTFLP